MIISDYNSRRYLRHEIHMLTAMFENFSLQQYCYTQNSIRYSYSVNSFKFSITNDTFKYKYGAEPNVRPPEAASPTGETI